MDRKRFKKILQNIFSVKHKGYTTVIMILGIRLRFYNYLTSIRDTCEMVHDINFKQNLIMDYFIDAKKAREASGALRNRQLENLKLLKEFIRISKCLNISYWLDYGSLLGAVRHGKTIPWDDDLDVSIIENDRNVLEVKISEVLGEGYNFINIVEDCQYRLVNKNYPGAFLDIYIYRNLNDMWYFSWNSKSVKDKDFIPHNVIFPLKNIMFEGIEVCVPCDYDKYLRNKYGNYNLLPHREHIEAGHIIPEERIVFKR